MIMIFKKKNKKEKEYIYIKHYYIILNRKNQIIR